MPLPIVRLVLICKAMEFAHKAMEFAQHFVNIEAQGKFFKRVCLKKAVQLIPCRFNSKLQQYTLASAIFSSYKDLIKNNSGQRRSAYYEYFTGENFSTIETTVNQALTLHLALYHNTWNPVHVSFPAQIVMELTLDLMFMKYPADLRCLANQNKPDNGQRHRVSHPV